MFAIKGTINELTKCKSRNGGTFYRIMLKKNINKERLQETFLEFFSFSDSVNSRFESNEIALHDIIEFTFYIKGLRRDEKNWSNNLMVKHVHLIKKPTKKG